MRRWRLFAVSILCLIRNGLFFVPICVCAWFIAWQSTSWSGDTCPFDSEHEVRTTFASMAQQALREEDCASLLRLEDLLFQTFGRFRHQGACAGLGPLLEDFNWHISIRKVERCVELKDK